MHPSSRQKQQFLRCRRPESTPTHVKCYLSDLLLEESQGEEGRGR